MKVLLIEDKDEKAGEITSELRLIVGQEKVEIDRASSLADGVRALSTKVFDLIVLDLMLPYLTSGEPDSRRASN